MSKQAGRFSESANDFLQPNKPIIGTATDVGTSRPYNNAAASVTFSLPGNSPAATSYTVTSSGGQTATGASSPIVISGLLSATAYTFTVTATNASGTSVASDASNSVTVTSVPQAPNATLASPNANEDQVSFSANATGGKTITGFSGTGSVSGSFGPTLTSPAAIAISAGTNESFTVYAINANGQSAGTNTNAIVTTAPFFPPFFPPYFPYFPYFPPYFPYFPGFGPYFPYFPGFGPSFAPMPSSNPPGRYH